MATKKRINNKEISKKTADNEKANNAEIDKSVREEKSAIKKSTAKKTVEKKEKNSIKKSAEKKKLNKVETDKKNMSKKIEISPLKETTTIKRMTLSKETEKDKSKKIVDTIFEKTINSTEKTTLKISNPIKKLEPIKTNEKEERETLKQLREAIKAKSKNISKPVSISSKRLIIKDDDNIEKNISEQKEIKNINPIMRSALNKNNQEINNVEEIKEKIKNKVENNKIEDEKATYNKSDIFKKTVFIQTNDEKLKNNIENSNALKENPTTTIENYKDIALKKIEELKNKDSNAIKYENELKVDSIIPEIEKKPVEPYKAPEHSITKEKKSNKTIAIIGVFAIVCGLVLLGTQLFFNKNEYTQDEYFYDILTNDITNSNVETNNVNTNIIHSIENNKVIEKSKKEGKTQETEINKENNKKDIKNTEIEINKENNKINKINMEEKKSTNELKIPPPYPDEPIKPTPPTINDSPQISFIHKDKDSYKTQWTDTLSSIAKDKLGDEKRWPTLFIANTNIFKDPDTFAFNKYIKIPNVQKKNVDKMNNSEKLQLKRDYLTVANIYLSLGRTNRARFMQSAANTIIK